MYRVGCFACNGGGYRRILTVHSITPYVVSIAAVHCKVSVAAYTDGVVVHRGCQVVVDHNMQVDNTVASVHCCVRTERSVVAAWGVEGLVLSRVCSRCPAVVAACGHILVHSGYCIKFDGAGHRLVAAVDVGVDDGESELVSGNTVWRSGYGRVAGVVCQACGQTGGAVILEPYGTVVVGYLYWCDATSLAY